MLRELQWSARSGTNKDGDKPTYLFPEELYRRACVLDPHPESFSQWMEWAARQPGHGAEQVATAWHKIRPQDSHSDPSLDERGRGSERAPHGARLSGQGGAYR